MSTSPVCRILAQDDLGWPAAAIENAHRRRVDSLLDASEVVSDASLALADASLACSDAALGIKERVVLQRNAKLALLTVTLGLIRAQPRDFSLR